MELATAFIPVADYLQREANSPIRHEYLGGQIFGEKERKKKPGFWGGGDNKKL